MRVVLLASGDLWAGAEVMVYQLACGLNKMAGVDIIVILLNKGRLAREIEKLGVRVQVVDESEYSFFFIVLAVRKIITEVSPDIIHSHRYKENLLAWVAITGLKNIKLIATQHGMSETAGMYQSFASRLRTDLFFRLLSHCFDRTVLVSCEMQQALVGSYGFSAKDVSVIHNGISIPDDVSRRFGRRVVVGSAGRIFPVKDFSLMVDIAHSVVSQSDNVDFVLAGDGPQRSTLEEKIRAYGLQDHFRLVGHQDDMDIFFRSLDVYINTSVHEGIPMSVLEAMSYGLPVVVPKVGGFPEIVEDGVSGYLVGGRNPEIFADKILALLQPDVRELMSRLSRQRVKESFSREAMARQYYEVYREVIDG